MREPSSSNGIFLYYHSNTLIYFFLFLFLDIHYIYKFLHHFFQFQLVYHNQKYLSSIIGGQRNFLFLS